LAENVFTIQEVLDEIKNNRQFKALAVLPYSLEVKQVDQDAIKVITEFSKKSGDYATLSATDIKVLALAYQLEKQIVGVSHLRKEPIIAKTVYTAKPDEKALNRTKLAGFYNPSEKSEDGSEDDGSDNQSIEVIDDDDDEEGEEEDEANENNSDESDESEEENEPEPPAVNDDELIKKFGNLGFNTIQNDKVDDILQPVIEEESQENESEEECSNEESAENEGDDEGWITPSNIGNVKKNFGGNVFEEKNVEVACITTDFAMQNVLKQMNLNVTSLDGRIIKYVRTFILRCYTCYKTTSDSTKIFCPKCGHKTLKRVSVSINEKGEQVIHLNPKKQITTKFKNQSLPRPKGGKHACNPLLFADQIIPQQRVSKKALLKTDALDDNYTAGYSPFVIRDLDSRSAKLRGTNNIKQWMQNYDYDNVRRGYKKNKK
jgi:RNA-binding protein NOB1